MFKLISINDLFITCRYPVNSTKHTYICLGDGILSVVYLNNTIDVRTEMKIRKVYLVRNQKVIIRLAE